MKVLLIQPPFWAVNSPSIGLGYLQAALRDAGTHAEVLYSNLDFAANIGTDIYEQVQCQLPVDFLYGDLVFGEALQGKSMELHRVQKFLDETSSKCSKTRTVPHDAIDQFASLSDAATQFVDQFKRSRIWVDFDLVGFSTTFSLVPALAMAKAIKETPDAPPVIFGGCHCEDSLGEALIRNFPWIDFVCRGDGEQLIVSLASHLQNDLVPLESIDGLLWREGEDFHAARKSRARTDDMDALPFPEYEDWFAQMEKHGWSDRNTYRMPIETSRGCWYGQKQQCIFCGLNGGSLEFRSKGADRVLKEYTSLLELDVPIINAVDSVLDPRFFNDVIPRIAALDQKATMFFEIRATISRDQLVALKNAGIRVLQPGIESLNSRLLQLMKKGTTAFQNVRLLKWAAELSMPISWNMLCGLPGEEADDYIQLADLAKSLTHLLPPITECNPIHVDRFSPLFEAHRSAIQPLPSYSLALGIDSEAIRDCAYHFEFDSSIPFMTETQDAISHLSSTVNTWQSSVGGAAFVSLQCEGRYRLHDSRPGAAHEEFQLDARQSQAFKLMENGCLRADLQKDLGISPFELEKLIQEFKENRWIVELDGKCLNLVVPMDEYIPEEIPITLQGSVATALFHHRMSTLWNIVKG